MITYFASLKSSSRKRNKRHYRTILEILLSSSKVEVISIEDQKHIFGKGYSYPDNKCSVYDHSGVNSFRIY